CLSSREVKSTGPKSRAVIFPSTVIANVALTNGRTEMWERPLRRNAFCRDAEVPPTFLLRLRDFMFRRGHFAFHFTQLHALGDAARFVEEVNDSARSTADHDDEKAERPDQFGFLDRDAANVVKHYLKQLFSQSDSGKTDRNRGERALNGHDREKVESGNWRGRRFAHVFRMKRVSDEKKSGESGQMRDQRGGEGKERRDPMPRVKMIGGCDFDQFIFAGKFVRQEMEEI